MEQSILAQTCDRSRHTTVFTCYNVTAMAAGALGGLAAAALSLQPWVSAADAAFALYALLAVCTVVSEVPDMVKDLYPGQDLARMPQEQLQHRALLRGELDLCRGAPRRTTARSRAVNSLKENGFTK